MSTMTYTATTRRIARAEWTKLRTLPARHLVLTAKAATVAVFAFPVALLCNVVGVKPGGDAGLRYGWG
jgi:hypothetical protein